MDNDNQKNQSDNIDDIGELKEAAGVFVKAAGKMIGAASKVASRKGEALKEKLSDEEFQQMIENDAFLEYAQYVEHSYGTPRQYVEENLAAGYDVILEIEQQGAFAVKKAVPEAILIFLTPPTIEELERRLRNRKTESDDVIASRLAQACAEAAHVDQYDYIVINDEVEHCVDAVNRLIETEHQRTQFNSAKIQELQRNLQPYRKGE